MIMFHHKLLTRGSRVSGQWVHSSISHDNICSLIHKKCHPKSYYSDRIYCMTLNIMFSVVSMHTKEYDVTQLVRNDNVSQKVIATCNSKW